MPEEDDGASRGERLIGACIRGNVDAAREIFAEALSSDKLLTACTPEEEEIIADLVNNSRSPLGNAALLEAVRSGCHPLVDLLTTVDGVEMDPQSFEGNYTLHEAVIYANNELAMVEQVESQEWEQVVMKNEVMVDALLFKGADPRMKDRDRRKAIDLLDGRFETLRLMLLEAETTSANDPDVVDEDNRSEGGDGPPSDED